MDLSLDIYLEVHTPFYIIVNNYILASSYLMLKYSKNWNIDNCTFAEVHNTNTVKAALSGSLPSGILY